MWRLFNSEILVIMELLWQFYITHQERDFFSKWHLLHHAYLDISKQWINTVLILFGTIWKDILICWRILYCRAHVQCVEIMNGRDLMKVLFHGKMAPIGFQIVPYRASNLYHYRHQVKWISVIFNHPDQVKWRYTPHCSRNSNNLRRECTTKPETGCITRPKPQRFNTFDHILTFNID
jgi:hypothetical protein